MSESFDRNEAAKFSPKVNLDDLRSNAGHFRQFLIFHLSHEFSFPSDQPQ